MYYGISPIGSSPPSALRAPPTRVPRVKPAGQCLAPLCCCHVRVTSSPPGSSSQWAAQPRIWVHPPPWLAQCSRTPCPHWSARRRAQRVHTSAGTAVPAPASWRAPQYDEHDSKHLQALPPPPYLVRKGLTMRSWLRHLTAGSASLRLRGWLRHPRLAPPADAPSKGSLCI